MRAVLRTIWYYLWRWGVAIAAFAILAAILSVMPRETLLVVCWMIAIAVTLTFLVQLVMVAVDAVQYRYSRFREEENVRRAQSKRYGRLE